MTDRILAEKALSLIEVLMGIVILGTALAPVAMLLGGALGGSEMRHEDARSLYLAQGKMEEVLALSFDDLPLGYSFSDWVTAPDSVYRTVTVSMNPEGRFDSNVKQISVTVGELTILTYRTDAFEP